MRNVGETTGMCLAAGGISTAELHMDDRPIHNAAGPLVGRRDLLTGSALGVAAFGSGLLTGCAAAGPGNAAADAAVAEAGLYPSRRPGHRPIRASRCW